MKTNGNASFTRDSAPRNVLPAEVAQEIFAAITGLRFGSVEITVHDSKVVQIERKEKVRFAGDNPRK